MSADKIADETTFALLRLTLRSDYTQDRCTANKGMRTTQSKDPHSRLRTSRLRVPGGEPDTLQALDAVLLTDRDKTVVNQSVDTPVLEQPPGVLCSGDVALAVKCCEHEKEMSVRSQSVARMEFTNFDAKRFDFNQSVVNTVYEISVPCLSLLGVFCIIRTEISTGTTGQQSELY